MKLALAVLICLFALSCSHDPQGQPVSPDLQHLANHQLTAFTVTVIDRAPATAIIQWTVAINNNNNDTVRYKIKLNDRTVDSNLITLTDTLKHLGEDTAYNGRVYAYTKSGDTASAPFFLPQLNGFIFFGDADHMINCFDIYSGQRVWQTQTYSPGRFLGIPTIVNKVLYANSDEAGTFAFNARTGALLWNTTYTSGYANGSETNPLYANGTVYTVVTGGIYALNAANGSVLWSFPTTMAYDGNPVMAGNLLISHIYNAGGKILALDATTGQKVWADTMNTNISRNPVVYKDLLIFGGSDGKIYALKAATGALVWSRNFSVTYYNYGADFVSPVIYKNLVIVHDGNSGYYGLNAADGTTVWNYPASTPNISSPILGGDSLYFTLEGSMIALKAPTGEQIWLRTLPPNTAWPSPIYVKGRLYLGNNLTNGWGIPVYNAANGNYLKTIASTVNQWGKETIVDNDTTYYLAQSGMLQ